MNIGLGSIAPTLLLLVEEKFGPSTLQNYDAILRNKPLAPRLSMSWRVVLCFLQALPIGLSAAYKTFSGGQSIHAVNAMDYVSNVSYYGIFPPPGLSRSSFSRTTGISLFVNATLPFLEATSPEVSEEALLDGESNNSEPLLPMFPQPYGYNILLLNNSTTAVLDIFQTGYLAEIQTLLPLGASWLITAPVAATVAGLTDSKTKNPADFNTTYISACSDANGTGHDPWSWDFTRFDMYNEWSLSLLNRKSLSDQSRQYIGIEPNLQVCKRLPAYVQGLDVQRRQCEGTWSITRAGFQLVNGSCSDENLPPDNQLPITYNHLALGAWYVPILAETMTTFSGGGARGNKSDWMLPYMSTSVAAMVWSRLVTLNSPSPSNFSSAGFDMSQYAWTSANGTQLAFQDVRTVYPIDASAQSILYIRPTLQKSLLFYFVLAIQPLLVLLIIGMCVLFYSSPMCRGFGLVSILSGMEIQSLNYLAGASLSGELIKPVKLVISPVTQVGENGVIKYRLAQGFERGVKKRKVQRNVTYH